MSKATKSPNRIFITTTRGQTINLPQLSAKQHRNAMHSQLIFRLFVVLLLGVTTAYVLPQSNTIPRDITEVTKFDSDIIKPGPAKTPVYHRSPDTSAQLARKVKREDDDSQELPFPIVPVVEGPKVTARDSTEEGHHRLYKRDGGMVAIYATIPVLVIGFLIGGVIIWRKAHGY